MTVHLKVRLEEADALATMRSAAEAGEVGAGTFVTGIAWVVTQPDKSIDCSSHTLGF